MNEKKGSNRIVIPIGPQHPSLKEPGCFTITLEGEKVVDAHIGIGYNHRGLEVRKTDIHR
jgi:Ni,Fe-hydrogenase III large subunit